METIKESDVLALIERIQTALDNKTEQHPQIDTTVYNPGLALAGVVVNEEFSKWKADLRLADNSTSHE